MNDMIPIALIALELGTTADELTRRLGDDVQVDDVGFRCITKDSARRLFEARDAALAEQRRQHEEWQRRYNEQATRIRATIGKGIPATPGSSALADMIGYER